MCSPDCEAGEYARVLLVPRKFSPIEDAVVLDQRDILGKNDEEMDLRLRSGLPSEEMRGVFSLLEVPAAGCGMRGGVARGSEAPREPSLSARTFRTGLCSGVPLAF